MNSQRKSKRFLLALGAVLFFGVSTLSLKLLYDQRLARQNSSQDGQVAAQQAAGEPASGTVEGDDEVQSDAQSAQQTDEKATRRESAGVSHQSESDPPGINLAETAPERIKPAQPLPEAGREERDRDGRKEEREAKPDHPDEAARFRRLQMQDENKLIPVDGLEKARRHIARMKAAQQERLRALRQNGQQPLPEVNSAGIKPDSWHWLGPGNVGGRIRSIAIHPTNTNTMWVGSVSGGIWRTDNGGASWQPVDDFMANLSVTAIIINPTNPDIMYAGTGEGFGNNDALQGAGIFQSTDGGVTWNQLASTANPDWFYVMRLAISPDGNTLLAATALGGGRSTDGGATWTFVTGVVLTYDIDFNPADSNRAVAGQNGGAGFSTDGGETWADATFNPAINGRVEVAYAPSDPDVIYASVNQNQGDIYKSTDGGKSYERVNTGKNFLGGQGWYDNIIWVNPQDADFLIVGGIDLWRSTDGGANLRQISKWQEAPKSAHADHHMIVAHPGFNNDTNQTVFFGNDGGIYSANNVKTVSLTSGWKSLNNNLGITQFYGAAGNARTGVIIGGTQDNGTVRFAGSAVWPTTFGGDGGFCAADPTDSKFFYGEYVNLTIFRSKDGGASASHIYDGITDANNGANFIAPFILDPNNANTMLAGGLSLWRSTNVKAGTPSWTAIKDPIINNAISAIAVAQGDSNIIWVGHNSGSIFYTTNGTDADPSWTQITAANLPARFTTRLTIDPNDCAIVYATFGGFSANNVYRTTDSGTTWTDVTGTGASGLPDAPVRTLVVHPSDSKLLYAGTEVGIFTSEDGGANWELPQNGPANVSVDELFWLAGDLIAVTHGRGLYRASGGVYVDLNYTGVEKGTREQPFKTVIDGVNAVPTNGIVWISPGNYKETMRIDRAMQLRSFGGAVTIGRP